MKYLEKLAKDKLDLKIIIGATLSISLGSIIFYNLAAGDNKLTTQMIRFGLTFILCYYLYYEKQWARWILTIFFFITGGFVIFIILTIIPRYSFSNESIIHLIFALMGLFYLSAGIYLSTIRKWKKP